MWPRLGVGPTSITTARRARCQRYRQANDRGASPPPFIGMSRRISCARSAWPASIACAARRICAPVACRSESRAWSRASRASRSDRAISCSNRRLIDRSRALDQRLAPTRPTNNTAAIRLAAATAFHRRRAHRAARAPSVGGRARIGRSARNSARCSASSPAVWYRSAGSFASALSAIVRRSSGIAPSSWRENRGSSEAIRISSSARSSPSMTGRRASIS